MENQNNRNNIIYKKHQWGLTVRELGKIYHISPTRVAEIIQTIKKQLQLKQVWGDLPLLFISFLTQAGLTSLDQVSKMQDSEILNIRGIGHKRLKVIRKAKRALENYKKV